MSFEGHHMGAAQRVNPWVRYLRAPMLAIISQSPPHRREKRRGRIVSHAPVRFFAAKQRREENLELILGPACRAGQSLGFAGKTWTRIEDLCNVPLRDGVLRLPCRHPL